MIEVTIYRTYFLESDIHDGEFPRDDVREEHYLADDVEEAARWIRDEGLSFEGNEWAGNPDGSQIIDYALGRRVEVSAHLNGVDAKTLAAIVELVG